MTRAWMRKVGQSPHESDPLVPKSRDYARSDQISTLSEVIIEFYVEIRVYKSPNTILQRNVERFSRIIRSTQGQDVNFGRGSGGAMP